MTWSMETKRNEIEEIWKYLQGENVRIEIKLYVKLMVEEQCAVMMFFSETGDKTLI